MQEACVESYLSFYQFTIVIAEAKKRAFVFVGSGCLKRETQKARHETPNAGDGSCQTRCTVLCLVSAFCGGQPECLVEFELLYY